MANVRADLESTKVTESGSYIRTSCSKIVVDSPSQLDNIPREPET
jgi:hypothetical protein